MLFLSTAERRQWERYAEEALRESPEPGYWDSAIRKNLIPAFHFYIATFLAAHGEGERGIGWLESGTLAEEEGLFGCGFLLGFLRRHGGRLIVPVAPFQDPRPFIHFAGVPAMKTARQQFVRQCTHSLPVFDRPLRFMDIGCGDGALTAAVLNHLVEAGKAPGISEVLLIEPSPAMADLAEETVRSALPGVDVMVRNSRIQDCSSTIGNSFDIAMSSLAYHHMPLEQKRVNLSRLKPWIDHLVLFEMDANNDTPDLYTPDLALSVYQSYSRIIDFIFTHDAPVDLAIDCVDSFMMAEIVSLLTEPRGKRLDYHMLRGQWHALFSEVLGPEFSCRCDSSAYADEYMTLFTLHYGRD
ncbi:MAG: Methyltransferase domain protein [Methanoregulaceae archaeon PtaB.Bin009]|jgi:SAM-dependent methyltransferase|nr:MAG: Methyltransferase domain protein [Methanoregulaceae archaeon PtaB.Bin009]OPY40729.1 MAG: Methyltransferase domain protein [Methanoregulaceae archaeon PtaU1.Bin066]HNQ30427.1 class I SAM-dependent methyltransferase [Methanolinea sp.]